MRLLIDGNEVALDNDLSIDYIVSNPFLTKDGGYTLDITVDLNIPSNALLYGNMQRMDVRQYPRNRSAIVMSDGRTVIQGTEIILSVESGVAKIQIVEGNSELNYLSSERKSIRDIPNIGVSSYVIPPFQALVKNSLGMNRIFTFNYNPFRPGQIHCYFPKLLGIINDVIRDAGYEVGSNVLNSQEEYNDLYIVPERVVDGAFRPEDNNFKEYLPAWSANEFFTEVEKFFNVVFVKRGNVVDIRSLNEYFSDQSNKVYIADEDVIDNFSKVFDVDTNIYTNYSNVRYDLPDNLYYKYADIKDDVREKCSTTFFFDTLPGTENTGKFIIYRSIMYLYAVVRKAFTTSNGSTKNILMQCLQFQHHTVDADAAETVLKIIPAQITSDGNFTFGKVFPYIGNLDWETFEITNNSTANEEVSDLNNEIENGLKNEALPSRMRVAFISHEADFISKPGSVHNTQHDVLYESSFQSWTTPYVVSSGYVNDNEQVFACTDERKNLSLTYRYENFYKPNVKVDSTVEYTIRFRNNKNMYDAKSIFYIHNIAFYCKELRVKLHNDGMSDVTEGVFYRIK